MNANEQRLETALLRLESERGGRVRHFNFVEGSNLEQRLVGAASAIESLLEGKYRRIFMIDTEDKNGWLHALEDVWNLADKAGETKLAGKLEEIIKHHMKLAGE